MIFNDLKPFLVVPATGIESFQSPGKLAERLGIVSVKNDASVLNQFYTYENSNSCALSISPEDWKFTVLCKSEFCTITLYLAFVYFLIRMLSMFPHHKDFDTLAQ